MLKAIREDWQGEALYGVNSISAAFAAERREIHALYFQEGKLPFLLPEAGCYVDNIGLLDQQLLL